MKVALLQAASIDMDLNYCGGLERTILLELEYLRKSGHDATLFVSKLIGEAEGIKVIRKYYDGKYSKTGLYYPDLALEMLYYIQFRLRAVKADILHGHYTPMLPLFGGAKAIVHFQGLGIHELTGYRYFRPLYHKAHYVFCSKFVQNQFCSIYPDIPRDNLHVLYNCVDAGRFFPPANPIKRKVKNIIVYGGWIPEKGIIEAIEAAKYLFKKGYNFKLFVGGAASGHYKGFGWCNPEEFEKKVRQSAEGHKNIIFLGSISYNDLPTILRDMDIGLMSSTYDDPFPLVTLELMASGLPVVAFANGGVKEQVVSGETGFLVEGNSPEGMAAAIGRLLDNNAMLNRMSAAARKRTLALFTGERHCQELEAIYSLMTVPAQ